jgi:two-component system LytT family sensor kinase
MVRKPIRYVYWLAQILGWSFYIFLVGLNSYLNDKLTPEVTRLLFAIFASGILVSHFQRYIIVNNGWLGVSIGAAIPRMLISVPIMAVLMSTIQILLSEFLIADSDVFENGLKVADGVGIWLSWFIIFTFWTIIYYAVFFFDKSRNEEIKNLRWEAMKSEIELNNLKSQLNPHFMFNSMNSIRALIDENPELAKEAVTKLSNILRSTLLMGRKRLVTVEDELNVIYDYLKLEGIRYEERLRVVYNVDQASYPCLIPPLMVQTLVENAIKHGISKLTTGGELEIEIKPMDDFLIIKIMNSGVYTGNIENSTGIGINNTVQRLELLFGKKASFNIHNENQRVVAQIKLPKNTEL